MMIQYKQIVHRHGSTFHVTRNGVPVDDVKAMKNRETAPPNRKYLMLETGTNIFSGDHLVGAISDEELFIEEVCKADIGNQLVGLRAFYVTRADLKDREAQQANVTAQNWNIGSNYGIVGNQANASQVFHFDRAALDAKIDQRGEDVEKLHDLVGYVQELQTLPEIPRGALAQFSDLMQKHSWLTQSLLGALLTYVSQYH